MNCGESIASVAALAATSGDSSLAQAPTRFRGFPASISKNDPYIEKTPASVYHWASLMSGLSSVGAKTGAVRTNNTKGDAEKC